MTPEQTKTDGLYILPAEWAPQSCVQLTWPHESTDWQPILDEITETYVRMAIEIAKREGLIIVAPQPQTAIDAIRKTLNDEDAANADTIMANITTFACPTDDTWARDHGAITLIKSTECSVPNSELKYLDFRFNGWGNKFEAEQDNAITRKIHEAGLLCGTYESHLDFVLEGGAIESDGRGTIFTTTGCLMAPHRNQPMTQQEIEDYLKRTLHAERIVWIDHGNLTGDDTDGHIDTLVRIAPDDTLLYVGCDDELDEQFADLRLMEEQLKTFRTIDGRPYRLLKLPMPRAIYDDGDRLPATYANFLIINGAVLYPTYDQPDLDSEAERIIAAAFPGLETVGIDCRNVIKQHGSLHCCTMQFPK